jgi:hypothetical protein
MSIVTQQIAINNIAGDSRYVVYEFTDHLGKQYQRFRKRVPVGFDVDADILSLVPQVETELAENEAVQARDRVLNGENPETIALNPEHGTSKQIAKSLIRWMMQDRDPYIVIFLEPLIVYLRANYTAAQLKTFLDITAAQAIKMDARIDAILNNKVDLQIAESNMEVIE